MKANKLIWMALAILLGVGTGTAGAATNEVSALLQQGLFEEEANQNLDSAIQAYQSVIAQTDKNRQFAATAIFRLGECYRKQGKTNEAAAQYQRILRDYADQPELAKLSRQCLAGFGVATGQASSADNADARLWDKVKNLSPPELEKVLPTLVPDPVLTSLLQQRNEAETALAQIKNLEGEHNPDRIAKQAVLDTINQQISQKIAGIMGALQLRAEISAPGTSGTPAISDAALQTQKQLLDEEIKVVEQQLQSQQARVKLGVIPQDELSSTQMKLLELKRQRAALDSGQFVSPQMPAATDDEDKELARIQTMIQNTPDLITGSSGELVNAAKNGQLRVATFLLDHGANINGSQADARPLVHAAAQDQKTMVDLLLSRGADINARDQWGETALIDAAEHGYKSVVEALLAHHAELNSKRPDGVTALHRAAQKGFADIAGLLITNGADVNAADNSGNTPLHDAAVNGNTAVMELLIAHKAAVNSPANDGETPLFAAVQQGRLDAAALLLKNGADVNAKQNGSMPLHAAVGQNNREMAKLLLDNGADANARIASYNPPFQDRTPVANVTPLIMAVMNREPDIVTLLIAHHADVNATDASGDSALTVLAGIKLDGQDTTPRGRLGMMPPGMPFSSMQGLLSLKSQLAIADLLLAAGADVNAQNNNRQSALCLAVINRSPELVKFLLQHKAKVDVLDQVGLTPLFYAVEEGKVESAGLLLDAGANPEVKYPASYGYPMYRGLRLLGYAVQTEDKPMVEMLLAHKADPNAQDDSGETPLSALSKAPGFGADSIQGRNMGEIAALLRSAGANENLHRLSTISVSRASADYAGADYTQTVFLKGTNSFNRYSLFQLLTAFYAPPIKTGANSPSVLPGLAFPDFGKVRISRLQKDGQIKFIPVDLETLLVAGDCSQDVPLEWGDVVEIPEADHKIGETWMGLADDKERQMLWKCLGGKVAILVKGQTNLVELTLRFFHPAENGLANAYSYSIHYPAGFDKAYGTIYQSFPDLPKGPWSFWLYDVVHDANVILTSSDLSRVKVTRFDAATRKPVIMVFDLGKKDPANDLWLRDGDVIELPEKP